MIQVSLENKDARDKAPYRERYKEVYVRTFDFGVASLVAKARVGNKYTITTMCEMEADVLDENGDSL